MSIASPVPLAQEQYLPEGWAEMRVGDHFESWGGMTPSTSEKSYWGGNVPWVSSKDIKQWRVSGGQESITKKALADTRLRLCPIGSVLVVVRSGILAHTLPVAVTDAEVTINQDLKAFWSPLWQLNEWLAFALRAFAPKILDENRKDGTTVQSIRYSELCDLILPVPPPDEQKRIVEKVDQLLACVTAARERLALVPAILKRFRQAVLAAACSGRLTADWRESCTGVTPVGASVKAILKSREEFLQAEHVHCETYPAPREISENARPELPAQWGCVSSDALLRFVTSGSRGWAKYYSDGGPKYLRVGNLDHDTIQIDLSEIQHVNPQESAERERTKVKPGDILISITAEIGMIALVPSDIGEAYINQHVALARPVTGFNPAYLAWFLASPNGGQAQFQELQRGATKVGLGLDDIRSLKVPLPPIEEQNEIVSRVEELFSLADAIEKRLAGATKCGEKLTQAILAKAFRGELVPTEAELARREGRSYESASALLARIQATDGQTNTSKPRNRKKELVTNAR